MIKLKQNSSIENLIDHLNEHEPISQDAFEYINQVVNNSNYYIILFLISKLKCSPYIEIFYNIIRKFETIQFKNNSEIFIEENFLPLITVNCLNQAIRLNADKFLEFYISSFKVIPHLVLKTLIEHGKFEIISRIIENKLQFYHLMINGNIFDDSINLEDIVDFYVSMRVKDVVLQRHITHTYLKYSLYTFQNIKVKYKNWIESSDLEILRNMIIMRDQELVEKIIVRKIINIDKDSIFEGFILSCKFNLPRVS